MSELPSPPPSDENPRRRPKPRSDGWTFAEIDRDFGHLPLILSVVELAAVLRRSTSTIYHWLSQGRLEGTYTKRGGRVSFSRTKVLLWFFNGPERGDARAA